MIMDILCIILQVIKGHPRFSEQPATLYVFLHVYDCVDVGGYSVLLVLFATAGCMGRLRGREWCEVMDGSGSCF